MNNEEEKELIKLLIKSYRMSTRANWIDYLDTEEESKKIDSLLLKYLLNKF